MKEGIHPDYKPVTISCVCGNSIETGSVKENLRVEICGKCHPFYTGTQKIIDTEGRIERFKKRYDNVAPINKDKQDKQNKRDKKEEAKKEEQE